MSKKRKSVWPNYGRDPAKEPYARKHIEEVDVRTIGKKLKVKMRMIETNIKLSEELLRKTLKSEETSDEQAN